MANDGATDPLGILGDLTDDSTVRDMIPRVAAYRISVLHRKNGRLTLQDGVNVLELTRDVAAGDQIFVEYNPDYWFHNNPRYSVETRGILIGRLAEAYTRESRPPPIARGQTGAHGSRPADPMVRSLVARAGHDITSESYRLGYIDVDLETIAARRKARHERRRHDPDMVKRVRCYWGAQNMGNGSLRKNEYSERVERE